MYGQEKRYQVMRYFLFTKEMVFIATSFQLTHCTYRCILHFLTSLKQVIWKQHNPLSAFLQQELLFLASRNGKIIHWQQSVTFSLPYLFRPNLQQAEYFRNNHKRNIKERETKQLPCSHGNAWEEFKQAPFWCGHVFVLGWWAEIRQLILSMVCLGFTAMADK